jgi:hypothetical protein
VPLVESRLDDEVAGIPDAKMSRRSDLLDVVTLADLQIVAISNRPQAVGYATPQDLLPSSAAATLMLAFFGGHLSQWLYRFTIAANASRA